MVTQPDELQQGIDAARLGRSEEARRHLKQAVLDNPNDVLAWVWLSEVDEGMDGRVDDLERALAIQPGNARIQKRLDLLKKEKMALQANLQEAARLLETGARQEALQVLRQVTLSYPSCERAWLMHSYAEPLIEDQLAALEKVLTLNPGNLEAIKRRDELLQMDRNPILLGLDYEKRGQLDLAIAIYHKVRMLSESTDERIEASLHMDQALARAQDPTWNPPSPTLTVLRLTVGPVLLFALLILFQSGLNPLHIELHFFLEGFLVVASSFILALTTSKPRHPRWLAEFGRPGEPREILIRMSLILLGVFFLVGTYLLFFLEAWNRLAIYRSTF